MAHSFMASKLNFTPQSFNEAMSAVTEAPKPSSPVIPSASARSGEAMRAATTRGHLRIAHIRRCQQAGKPSEAEIHRMVEAYLNGGGQIHVCTPAYVLPVQSGSGPAGRVLR